jgi:hypothetical protein
MSAPRLAVLFAATTTPLLAQVTADQFAAIRKEGFEKSQVQAHLHALVNEIGPRLTSSDNLTQAAKWARGTFQAFGLDAKLEQWGEFAVGFNRGQWLGRVTKPEPMDLVCNTDAWTAGTKGPAKGPLLAAPADAAALEAMKGKLRGVWLLLPGGGRLEILDAATAALESEGGFGFVTGSRNDLLLTGGRTPRSMENLPKLPMVRVRADQYATLQKDVADGKDVEVVFDIQNYFKPGPIALYNVIADLKGTEHPDEYVVVGGHLDSWDGATGTTDNGTGSATTIEAARILTAIGAKPKRTIRFMLWSGEEQGLLGSKAWVQEHKEEMTKYSACLVHDGGTNYLSGIAGMKEMRPQLEKVFAPILTLSSELPFKIRDIDAFRPIGSDHESFTAAGVPGFFWDQAGRANYTHTHHTQYDTYDASIPEYQKHSSVVIATGALGIANLPEMLTRENMKVERGFGGGARRGGRQLGVQLGDDGVTIAEVTDGGLAAKAGIKAGDKLVKIGDKKISAQADLRTMLTEGPQKNTVTFVRDGKEQTVEITFER